MIAILRIVGVVNAATWLGSAVFFTLFAGPAFFSPEMKAVIPPPYNGIAAQLVIQRYFYLQHICGGVAIAHLVAEWIYLGRPMDRLVGGGLVGMVCLGLIGGLWLQPKLSHLHRVKYAVRATPLERQEAGASFGLWHGISRGFDLVVFGGVCFYFWTVMKTPGPARFASAPRYRS